MSSVDLAPAWRAFKRPFELVGALRARPEDWKRFLRVTLTQAGVTVLIAAALMAMSDHDFDEGLKAMLAWLALTWSSLLTAQWVVLAFAREFHNPIGRALSDVAGISPEDSDAPPRIHLDWKWLRKKLRQRLRGLLVLLPGYASFVPVLLVTRPLGLDNFVMPPLMAGWTFYWWCAFTAGRSERAWRDESGTMPVPVRWWLERTEKTFGFRWFLPRWLGRFAVYATKRDAAPAVAIEHAPWTWLGLGLARLVLSWPLVRLFFRAAVDTAAAEALEKPASRAEVQDG